MEKISANRFLSRSECGGVAFSQSGNEIPRPHTFKVVGNFFHRRQFSSTVFHPRPGHAENNFTLPGDVKIRIANNINVFLRFFTKISAVHFVQWVAQSLPQILPCWLRMRNFSVNSDLSGGECGSRHFANPGMKFNARQLKLAANVIGGNLRPPFFASVPAMTKKVSGHAATRASESIFHHASKSFHFDQGLIFEAVGFGQNEAMKCFDADGETGRWISRPFSAASVWLIASATAKTKALINFIWKISPDKSCAQSALDDLKSLIALLRMLNAVAHKYRPDARKRFGGHQPQNHFAVGKMAVVDFRRDEIRGRRGGLPPVCLAVAVGSNRQPEYIFGRWLTTPFHRTLPMPGFNDFFDLKNLRFFRFMTHRPLRRKSQRHISACIINGLISPEIGRMTEERKNNFVRYMNKVVWKNR
jgi:hypothetical protein